MAVHKVGDDQIHPLADLDRTIHSPARLMIMTNLYVVESAEFIALMNLTGLSWGNLSTHLSKLEEAGYIEMEKGFRGKKPYTMVRLTGDGRAAFKAYKQQMQEVLGELPD
ncbi:MAG: winged helix-turn-helix domain-containing protein [Candidatus Promineifilaceae bacterium]|jgi:DNA-binding MarR family transcriptional regulator